MKWKIGKKLENLQYVTNFEGKVKNAKCIVCNNWCHGGIYDTYLDDLYFKSDHHNEMWELKDSLDFLYPPKYCRLEGLIDDKKIDLYMCGVCRCYEENDQLQFKNGKIFTINKKINSEVF